MNTKEIDYLRLMFGHAKQSYKIALSMVGDSTKLNRFLLKWVDVMESMMDYMESPSTDHFKAIVSDISPLVYIPVLTIADSFIETLLDRRHDDKQALALKDEFNEIIDLINIEDPIVLKEKLIDRINILAPLLGHTRIKT